MNKFQKLHHSQQHHKRFGPLSTMVVAAAMLLSMFSLPLSTATAAPVFKQIATTTPSTKQTTVNTAFASAQTAGDLNVVVVGWNASTATVSSVTDSRGNTYQVVAAVVRGTNLSQSMYYAKNIAGATAGANTVKVTFSASVAYPDVRVAEYSGLDTVAPLDVAASASGGTASASSGTATTTGANELLVGAGTTGGGFSAAGTGFTSRGINNDGDIVEDAIKATPGAYAATAPVQGPWVMQLAAFKTAGSAAGDTTAPTAPGILTATAASTSQINLNWAASTDNVGVTSYQLERCQGANCTAFTALATAATTSYSDTGLSAGTSYSYRVRAADAAGNLSGYSAVVQANTSSISDTTAPTAPTGLNGTATSNTQINLAWTASTDNTGVTGYTVYRNGAQVGTSIATNYQDTGLSPSTAYIYTVSATDAAGNVSDQSASVTVSTQATQASGSCAVATQHVSGGPDAMGGCWPGASNTGVPAGTVLTAYTGSCVVTTDNTVIDAKTLNCDLEIRANNIMIKNSKVNGLVYLDTDNAASAGWSFTLQDSEVDAGTQQRAAVQMGNMTILRSNIHGGVTAVQCEEKSTHCLIQDSYLHGQYIQPNSNWHLGGFLSDGGGPITLQHNYVACDQTAVYGSDGGCTGDINLIPNFGTAHDVTIDRNLLGANVSSAFCTYGGDRSDGAYPRGNHIVYTNNTFQRGANGHCANYGAVNAFNSNGVGNQWVNNLYDDGTVVEAAE